MTRKQLVSAFFIGLLIFITVNVFLILSPFMQPLFWSSVVAFILYPIYKKFLRIFHGRKNLAAFIVTLLLFIICLPVLFFLFMNLAQEAKNLYLWLSAQFENGAWHSLVEKIKQNPHFQQIENSKLLQFGVIKDSVQRWSMGAAHSLVNFSLKELGHLTRNILSGVINFFLIFILLFFWFKDGAAIIRFVYDALPLEDDTKHEIIHELTSTFTAVLRGQLVTSFIQSATAGIIFLSLGLPLPFLFAGVTFFTSLIPIIGAAGVWVPLVAYLLFIGEMQKAIILTILGAGIISTLDNFIKPYMIGNRTKLPYLLLFLGILGGLQIYGIVGIFVAPAVLSLFFVLIKIFREKVLTAE